MDSSLHSPHSLRDESEPLLGDQSTQSRRIFTESPPLSRSPIWSCTVVCILLTELCERLTFYGISANLVLFATEKDQLGFTSLEASVLAFIFQGTCFLLPVFGGWLADTKTGKFSLIFLGGIVYLVGTVLLPLGAIRPHDKHVPWTDSQITNKTFKRVVYVLGLVLVSIGTGAIKANVSPFGADQVLYYGPDAVQAFFAWFYWFINVGALIAFTFVVYVQQEYCYFYGYLIPTASLLISLAIFVSVRRYYNIRPPEGSAISTTLKIVKEAIKKSRRSFIAGKFLHSWLDRAKTVFGGSYTNWEVEDVKKVFRLMPIFGTFILYWTVYAQMSTSMVYQGQYMDINLFSSFKIPIASLAIFDTIGVLVLIPVMDKLVYPLLSKCNINLSQLQRIGIGMVLTSLSMFCAGGIELYRVKHCCMLQDRHSENYANVSNITIFYQVPQYTLIGLSEVLTSVAGLEFAYSEAPVSLHGVVMGIFLLITGIGVYLGAAFATVVNLITGRDSPEHRWYPEKNHINKGKLANYFFLLAGLMLLNFILYIFVSVRFKRKKDTTNIPVYNYRGLLSTSVPPESSASFG